ncbi:hypothetical protein, partial [Kocuria rosea]|uniref:hypothetical protein n=2 Tax=Bacteria TaxID=2 RepID=UPI002B255C80
MKIKSQDIKVGNILRSHLGTNVKITQAQVFGEKRSPLVLPGRPAPYIPPCVFVVYTTPSGSEGCYTFQLDEE